MTLQLLALETTLNLNLLQFIVIYDHIYTYIYIYIYIYEQIRLNFLGVFYDSETN